jgi:hypothetical protein
MTTQQQSFYQRIGFEQNSTTTMVLYNDPDSILSIANADRASQDYAYNLAEFADR